MKQYCFVAKSIQSKWGQNILTSSVNEREFWGDFAFKRTDRTDHILNIYICVVPVCFIPLELFLIYSQMRLD